MLGPSGVPCSTGSAVLVACAIRRGVLPGFRAVAFVVRAPLGIFPLRPMLASAFAPHLADLGHGVGHRFAYLGDHRRIILYAGQREGHAG
jgi:hypothetical protein